MKIEYLREFVALARTKNYSKTAEQFFISQSTLSKHIAAVEAEIGCNLINHDSYGLELTDFGIFALDEFSSLLEIYQKVLRQADQLKNGVRGQLVIGMLYYQANKWIRPIIQLFQSIYPEVRVKTVSGQPDQLFEGVSDGSIDAAFLFYNSAFMRMDTKKYRFLPVFHEPVIALFSPENQLFHAGRRIMLKQLAGNKLLRNENGPFMKGFNDGFEACIKKQNIQLDGSIILDNVDFLTSTIMETDSFLIQGIHIKEFHPDLGYAQIEDIAAMQTGIFTRKNVSNPLVDHLFGIVPEIRKKYILSGSHNEI